MAAPDAESRTHVQHLAPTWRQTPHENVARLLGAVRRAVPVALTTYHRMTLEAGFPPGPSP